MFMNEYDKIISDIAKDFKKSTLLESELDTNKAILNLKRCFNSLFQSFKGLLAPYLLSVDKATLRESEDELADNLIEFRNDFINVAKGMNALYKATAKSSIQNDLGFSDFIDKNTKELLEMYSRIIVRIPESETKRKLVNAYFAFDMMIRAMNTEIMLYNYQNENKLKTLKTVREPENYDFEKFDLKPFLDGIIKRMENLLDFKELKNG